ncbi:MAG: hypothetical protein BGN85_00990 [Alphaproteobacteria bacterium 64-11]|nr:hypothetical protein [Alphaproteobacteria bacterium]OJU12396.1 MAG: hypothetical protein BGN85_00990 [Alphaproteobacteria bacterium 64-11]
MTLALLDCLSLPGDPAKANEDAYGHDNHAALVMDGATMLGDGLMPGPSDAAWIAQFGARRILAHLKEGEGARKALRGALEDTKKSFEALRRMPPEDVWQTPCASMMLVTQTQAGRAGEAARPNPRPASESRRGAELEFLWFGDCAALVQQDSTPATVVGETFESRAAEAQRAQRLAREKQLSPAHGLSRQAFLTELRASRNRINRSSSWLFSPEPRAAAHAGRRILKVKPGAHLLLASDGFLALASDYGAYGVDSLMAAARNKGLAALGEELRAIENGDAGGDRFARFKKSDDCTALLLRLD